MGTSDIASVDGTETCPSTPRHSPAAIVPDIDGDATSAAPGDDVVPLIAPECSQCENCVNRNTDLCTAIRAMEREV